MALWSLLPAAASLATTLLNRPSAGDYRTDTTGLKRRIANLKSRRADREIAEAITRPASRMIGEQTAKTRRAQEAFAAREGLTGSGIEAQQILSRQQEANQALQEVGEQAAMAQIQENRRIGEQIDTLEGQITDIAAADQQRYETAQRQSDNQVMSAALGLGAQAVTGHFQAKADAALKTENLLGAVAQETGAAVTEEQLIEYAKQKGYANLLAAAAGYVNDIKRMQVANYNNLQGADFATIAQAAEDNEINVQQFNDLLQDSKDVASPVMKQGLAMVYDDSVPLSEMTALLEGELKTDDYNNLVKLLAAKSARTKEEKTSLSWRTVDGDVYSLNNRTGEVDKILESKRLTETQRLQFDADWAEYKRLQAKKDKIETMIGFGGIKFNERDQAKLDAVIQRLSGIIDLSYLEPADGGEWQTLPDGTKFRVKK